MAQIIPFRGYRYNPEIVGDLSAVVSPPYDRVDPETQERLYDRSPHNIVRIIKGKRESGDGDAENVYTRAATTLAQWIRGKVLVRDPEPGLYVYHQEYSFGGERLTRKGVIALGKLEPEKVHAHERTLKGPKEDRLRLMRATEANFGHIFMLYNDPQRAADAALQRAIDGCPVAAEAADADGNAHRIWRITDSRVIQDVQAAVADKDLYIADGHHRYETAVNFMRECQSRGWRPAAPESFDVRLMTLFNVAEPGMSIRPIHRLVHGISDFDADRFLEQAQRDFFVRRHASFDEMSAATAEHQAHVFGFATCDHYATLRLRSEGVLDDRIADTWSQDYKHLDVSILHSAILEPFLGIDAAALENETNVTYTVDLQRARKAVDRGDEQMVFVLNPTSAEEVVRVADHGEKMPQKSTDFYPKLLTGLVLTVMEMQK